MGYALQFSHLENIYLSVNLAPVPEKKNAQFFNAFLKASKLGPIVSEDGGEEKIISKGRHCTEQNIVSGKGPEMFSSYQIIGDGLKPLEKGRPANNSARST